MKVENYVFLSKEGKHENISLQMAVRYGVGLFHNGGRDCNSFELCKWAIPAPLWIKTSIDSELVAKARKAHLHLCVFLLDEWAS